MLFCAQCGERIRYPYRQCNRCGGQWMEERLSETSASSFDPLVWPPPPQGMEAATILFQLHKRPILTDDPDHWVKGFGTGAVTQIGIGLLAGLTPFGLYLGKILPQFFPGHFAFWAFLCLVPASVISGIARWMHWSGDRRFAQGLLGSLVLTGLGLILGSWLIP